MAKVVAADDEKSIHLCLAGAPALRQTPQIRSNPCADAMQPPPALRI
jgi:hypothetical protein